MDLKRKVVIGVVVIVCVVTIVMLLSNKNSNNNSGNNGYNEYNQVIDKKPINKDVDLDKVFEEINNINGIGNGQSKIYK